MTRRILAALLLASVAILGTAAPAAAHHTTAHERCQRVTRYIDAYRVDDLRTMQRACNVGAAEVSFFLRRYAATGGLPFHRGAPNGLSRFVASLDAAGTCWTWAGEVISWYFGPRSASRHVEQWRILGATSHWPVLMSPRADWGGGHYGGSSATDPDGYTVAVYYVVDTC